MVRYHAVLSEGEPADAPLAIGNLPKGWNPVQPVHMKLRDGRDRLYFWVHGPGVVRYLAAESGDGRRYRVVDPLCPCLYHPFDRASRPCDPALAGLVGQPYLDSHPQPPGEERAPTDLRCNDATTVYQLADGSFELFTPGLIPVDKNDARYVAHDNAPGLVRVIDRLTSHDGLRWENRQRVLIPDLDDPCDLQFYHLAVTHTPEGRVGLLGHYRVEAQTMDLEWCFSQDGIAWERPHRCGWLPRGEPGEADCYGIYPPHSSVYHGGQWWLFYTGVNHAHNHQHSCGQPRSVVMAAKAESLWRP